MLKKNFVTGMKVRRDFFKIKAVKTLLIKEKTM